MKTTISLLFLAAASCCAQTTVGNSLWPDQRYHMDKINKSDVLKTAQAVYDVPNKSYKDTAKLVHLKSSIYDDQGAMAQCLHDQALHVYSFAAVDVYLHNKAQNSPMSVWVWKPLRDSDHEMVQGMVGKRHLAANNLDWEADPANILDTHANGIVVQSQYDQPIPQRVLREVKILPEVCKDMDIKFLVSDYVTSRPDPFLAITTTELLREGKLWIIDVWDEPGFTEKPQPPTILGMILAWLPKL